MTNWIRLGWLTVLLYICLPVAAAKQGKSVQVSSTIQYQLIAQWDVNYLNKILTHDTPEFASITVAYSPARNAVRLYRITYHSVIPEMNNKPTVASGLLAVPDTGGRSFPTVSYQHGTVYGHNEVPSFADKSPETQLMIAQFAGQGYVLIGADYFGLGTSTEPESYMVKGSHQQATFDLLMASRAVLTHMQIASDKLFLAGWSQGGFVTMAFLEKLESAGLKVNAAATASAPLDTYALIQGFLVYPRKFDAAWLNSIMILLAFAYEHYYGIPGLARSFLTDEYYEAAKKVYDRQPFNPSDITTDLHKLIRSDYFDPQYFANSVFGKILSATHAYRWTIQSPVRNYYGEIDEAITPGVGRMAMTYAQSMGTGNQNVDAISTGPTTHRGTFATAVPQWKAWFDQISTP
ncbi:alpha/beta hydrolase [Aeromonas veronii]|uniref:alpha/beta hydrolase n=1 Tax=Aeromonas veronii TaxID=654 RepID=UPI003D1D11B0